LVEIPLADSCFGCRNCEPKSNQNQLAINIPEYPGNHSHLDNPNIGFSHKLNTIVLAPNLPTIKGSLVLTIETLMSPLTFPAVTEQVLT
jgi:hypothetical protein